MVLLKKILIGILTWESRLILAKYKPFIVAITGSVGKTSTKDAIYDVLKKQAGFVRKSEKSLNSEIGLPLTVIGVPNAWYNLGNWLTNIWTGLKLAFFYSEYPSCLVLEVGADHPGDIKKIAEWLHPDITVITRISRTPVHVEFFKSPEEVFEEKAALADAIKAGGTLVVFADDDKVLSLRDRVKGKNVSVVSYGFREDADLKGSDIKVLYKAGAPTGITFKIHDKGSASAVSIDGILGETYMHPLLAAVAVGKIGHVAAADILRALESYEAPKGRMNIIPGINSSTLIDDTYNSSPDAAQAALSLIGSLKCRGSKIAVLGDMMELGKFATGEHRRIGAEAAKIAGKLVTVGPRSRLTAEEAMANSMPPDAVKSFDTSKDAAEYLRSAVQKGDIVLIKGSQSVRMERVTAALMRDDKKAPDLLVRQEKEWLLKY